MLWVPDSASPKETYSVLPVSASAVLEDSEAVFADMALRLEKTKAEVRARLETKERAVVGRAERDVEQLEKDLEDLRRREKEICELLQSDDSSHFLQAAPLLCVPLSSRPSLSLSLPPEGFSGVRRALSRLRSRMEELCREEGEKISHAVNEDYVSGGECLKENSKPSQSAGHHTAGAVTVSSFPLSSLSLQPADQRMRAAFLRFSCRVSLDTDTAHPTLVLLEGPQGAHCGEEPQSYPPHQQRFDSVAQPLYPAFRLDLDSTLIICPHEGGGCGNPN
ncbi:hypothetical protein CgunFtcFv8_021506 [Champsocephalus gunnari]|uniref:SPRY-associated domain-containing protein n=1 Tax=Champsocephalus gunnari TaxID=52237 RepID=A0AAN8DUV5_CHAGU|nr:hypothetical protein CgunFtcFv8_021506 [Champsocephalus gunnari]